MALQRYHFRTSKIFRDRSPETQHNPKVWLKLNLPFNSNSWNLCSGNMQPWLWPNSERTWFLAWKILTSWNFCTALGEPREPWRRTTRMAQPVWVLPSFLTLGGSQLSSSEAWRFQGSEAAPHEEVRRTAPGRNISIRVPGAKPCLEHQRMP